MPATQKKQASPVHCGKFEQSRLSYTELEIDNERNKAQMIAYPRYNHPNGGENAFIFQTDWIQLTQYGLPKKGEKPGDFYMEDKDRTFLKVPLDPTQESCVHLEKMLSGIDKYNNKNTDKIFKNFAASKNTTGAKAAKLFTYQPTVRTPQVDDEFAEVTDGKAKTEKFKYCKMQFTTSYPEKNITSAVYLRENEEPGATVTESHASNATDLENAGLVWGSKVRMIVMVNKLWAAKSKNAQTGTRGFGVTMKIVQMEVIPREKSGSIREQFSRYAFIDGEESDDDVEVEQADGEDLEEDVEDVEDEEVDEEELEDEDDEDEDENDEEEEVEEEEEEEEEEVVVKAKSKKVAPKKGGKSRSTTSRK